MTCQHYRERLTDYQHGELDAAADAAVHEHLLSCAQCAQELAAQNELSDSLRAAFATELDMPNSILAGVRQAIRSERAPGLVESLRALLRPVVLAPTAAAIVLVTVVASHVHTASGPAQLSTDYFVQRHVAHTMNSQSGDRAWNAYLLTSNTDANANARTP